MEVGNPVGKTYLLTDVRSRHQVLGDLCVRMRKMPGAERDRLLETMGSGRDSRVDDADRAMTWPEARQLREYGVAVGAHTCSHVALSAIPEDEARRDIVESKRMIENELKMELRHFSYPHDDNDYVSQQLSAASRRLAVEAGFRSGVTVVRGVNRAGQDVMALRRITVRNWDAAEFARQIERGFEGL
jgi:peptidoglycan/xylan/chitin deacetylase (PgdA/CDA1 family)